MSSTRHAKTKEMEKEKERENIPLNKCCRRDARDNIKFFIFRIYDETSSTGGCELMYEQRNPKLWCMCICMFLSAYRYNSNINQMLIS